MIAAWTARSIPVTMIRRRSRRMLTPVRLSMATNAITPIATATSSAPRPIGAPNAAR